MVEGNQLEDIRLQPLQCSSVTDMLTQIFDLPYEKKMLIVACLWSWWYARNKENHQKRRLSTEEFQFTVQSHASEWKEFFKTKPKATVAEQKKWSSTS
jgi:hypothetical protein